jgi:ribosome-associated toxin RatA of RatAB toxin-antitoxin module
MRTAISSHIRAEPATVFRLAARVEDWPSMLPHYRWVRVLEDNGTQRLVDMAARRDVFGRFGIPLHWVSIQRVYPERCRIEFDHVAGITRGMHVEWSIDRCERDAECTIAAIRHVFAPEWPVPDRVLDAVLGEYFVNGVASRTLARVGEVALRP